jgi:hypothetical protein
MAIQKRLNLMKKTFENNRLLVMGGLALVVIVIAVVLPVINPFETFSLNDDWNGSIEIDGIYLPSYGSTYHKNPSLSSRDSMYFDIDGSPAAPYQHWVLGEGTMYKWQDDGTDCTLSFANLPADGTGKTAKIYSPDWFPDFYKYPTMMPTTTWDIGDLIQVGGNVLSDISVYSDYFTGDVEESISFDKIVESNTPSISGGLQGGEFSFEGYYYYLQLEVAVDARKLDTVGDGYHITLNHDGTYASEMGLPYLYEFTPINSIECVFEVDYTALNSHIIAQFSDMKTFGPLSVAYYKDGSRVSLDTVTTEMEDNDRSYATLFGSAQGGNINKDVILSGMDRHAGLQVVDSSIISELGTEEDYFYFGFDKLAIPGYWEATRNIVNLRDSYNMVAYDMKIIVPLLVCVFNIYDIPSDDGDTIDVTIGTETYDLDLNNDDGSDENENIERDGMFNIPISLEDAFAPTSIGFTMVVIVAAIVVLKRK